MKVIPGPQPLSQSLSIMSRSASAVGIYRRDALTRHPEAEARAKSKAVFFTLILSGILVIASQKLANMSVRRKSCTEHKVSLPGLRLGFFCFFPNFVCLLYIFVCVCTYVYFICIGYIYKYVDVLF